MVRDALIIDDPVNLTTDKRYLYTQGIGPMVTPQKKQQSVLNPSAGAAIQPSPD